MMAKLPGPGAGLRSSSMASQEISSSLCASQCHSQPQQEEQGITGPSAGIGGLPPKFPANVKASCGVLEQTPAAQNALLENFLSEEQEGVPASLLVDSRADDEPPEMKEVCISLLVHAMHSILCFWQFS